jgi:metallo-beta-lactamase class B
MRLRKLFLCLLFVLVTASAQTKQAPLKQAGKTDWNAPFPAHKVIGNVYFVGSAELASFLITTPQGDILINSDFEATVPVIRASVEKLGFKFTDIKILLGSHAHAIIWKAMPWSRNSPARALWPWSRTFPGYVK